MVMFHLYYGFVTYQSHFCAAVFCFPTPCNDTCSPDKLHISGKNTERQPLVLKGVSHFVQINSNHYHLLLSAEGIRGENGTGPWIVSDLEDLKVQILRPLTLPPQRSQKSRRSDVGRQLAPLTHVRDGPTCPLMTIAPQKKASHKKTGNRHQGLAMDSVLLTHEMTDGSRRETARLQIISTDPSVVFSGSNNPPSCFFPSPHPHLPPLSYPVSVVCLMSSL